MTATTKLQITRGQWITIAISLMAVILTFTGLNYQVISSDISKLVSPPTPDFTFGSYLTPQILPSGFLYLLSPASDYYVATSIHLSTDTPYMGNSFYFSVSFDNKGKKTVQEPYVEIYLLDSYYREWALWNKSITNNQFSSGFSLAYNFPTLDQKTIGTWSVLTLLYDNATKELVSANTTEFNVTDNAPPPAWVQDSVLATLILTMFVTGIAVLYKIIKDLKTQAMKKKRAEKEEKGKSEEVKFISLLHSKP